MAGLKARPPLMVRLAPSVSYLGGGTDTKDRDAARCANAGASLRNLYNTKRWRHPETGMRVRILTRDGFSCRMCGIALIGEKGSPTSPVVDHIRPHRDNLALFWDQDNLQCLCKFCHDGAKQIQDRAADKAGGLGLKSRETRSCRPVPLQSGDFFFWLRVFHTI